MDELVVLVNLEDESVVYIEAAEHLYAETCCEKYEADDSCEVVCVHSCVDLVPVGPCGRRTYAEEKEEGE